MKLKEDVMLIRQELAIKISTLPSENYRITKNTI